MKSLVISSCSVSSAISTTISVLILSNEVLHPYSKLVYIKLAWGGAEEQAAERVAGNKHAKNWQESQDEARKVVEREVSHCFIKCAASMNCYYTIQLELYWKTRPHSDPLSSYTLNISCNFLKHIINF
jgi:hypothetical protein